MRKTTKPRELTVRQWISRIQDTNTLIPIMSNQTIQEFTDQELALNMIAENILRRWAKDFALGGGATMTTISQVQGLLEVLEKTEGGKYEQRKEKKQGNERG